MLAAVKFYNKSFFKDLFVGDSKILFSIAGFYFQKKYYREAAEVYKILDEQGDVSAEVLQKMAYSYQKLEKYQQALDSLQSYFDEQLQSKGRRAYEFLTEILTALNRSDDVIPQLEKLAEKRQHGFCDFCDGGFTHAATDEQARSYWRCAQADTQISDQHDPEVNFVHAERLDDRQKDRRKDQHSRCHIHERSDEQQQQIDR